MESPGFLLVQTLSAPQGDIAAGCQWCGRMSKECRSVKAGPPYDVSGPAAREFLDKSNKVAHLTIYFRHFSAIYRGYKWL